MSGTFDSPAKCKLHSAIRFLQAEEHNSAEIHHQMGVYGKNLTSDDVVRE